MRQTYFLASWKLKSSLLENLAEEWGNDGEVDVVEVEVVLLALMVGASCRLDDEELESFEKK